MCPRGCAVENVINVSEKCFCASLHFVGISQNHVGNTSSPWDRAKITKCEAGITRKPTLGFLDVLLFIKESKKYLKELESACLLELRLVIIGFDWSSMLFVYFSKFVVGKWGCEYRERTNTWALLFCPMGKRVWDSKIEGWPFQYSWKSCNLELSTFATLNMWISLRKPIKIDVWSLVK